MAVPPGTNPNEGPATRGDGFVFAPKSRNFMEFIAYDLCARPFWVLALTFVPAFIEAAITLRIYDMEDLIRTEAKILAGGRPAGGKHGKRHTKVGRAPARQPPSERWSQKGLGHLLRWTQPLENLGFALLMYSAVDQFFYRWQTLIEAVDPCPGSTGSFGRHADNAPWSQLAGGGAAAMNFLDQNTGGWSSNPFVAGLPPGKYMIVMTATLQPNQPGTFQSGIQLRLPGLGGDEIVRSGLQELRTGEPKDFVVYKLVFISGFLGTTVGWQTYGDSVPTGVRCIKGTINISQDVRGLSS